MRRLEACILDELLQWRTQLNKSQLILGCRMPTNFVPLEQHVDALKWENPEYANRNNSAGWPDRYINVPRCGEVSMVLPHTTVSGRNHATNHSLSHTTVRGLNHATDHSLSHTTVRGLNHATDRSLSHTTVNGQNHATDQQQHAIG